MQQGWERDLTCAQNTQMVQWCLQGTEGFDPRIKKLPLYFAPVTPINLLINRIIVISLLI